ncbi:MAG: hypothetical protein KIT84_32410 [Labilithrix sp.]|nr:hypothetical protein [Labilithrix sp.]MCW5815777.1 hypothetical protein [Labilithrix sp.]
MTSIPLRVRVVPVRQNRWLSWIVGVAGGLLLLWVVATHSPHDPGALAGAGASGALWMIGLLLSGRPAPYVARVAKEEGGLQVGRTWVPAVDLEASIVEAQVGASVAFSWPRGELFVETSTLEDARTLVRLSQAEVVEDIVLRAPVPFLRLAKATVVALGVLACILLAALPYESSVFGALVFCGAVASVLHIVESFAKRRVVLDARRGFAVASGSIREHVLLHIRRAAVEREPRVQVRVLARGEEPTHEWLGRLDGVANDAYRGELPPKEELHRIAFDATSPVHERLGAARLLVRRYAVPIEEIEGALEPELVPYFLEIGHEDVTHAARAIDRLGPFFRP